MEVSKIHLSATESELMQNADIILTKNSVLKKMKLLLEEVQDAQLNFVTENHLRDHELFFVSPKISRGENYMGLPWLILDYPRTSNPGGMFFIRSMFWWGRFFSSTLHVSGRYREKIAGKIIHSYEMLKDYYLGIHEDPWSHHFEKTNYQLIGSFTEQAFRKTVSEAEHLKVAAHWPLSQWQQAPAELFNKWKWLMQVSGSVS